MALLGRIRAPVFGGAVFTVFTQGYESLSSYTGTDLVAEAVVATFTHYCLERIQESIQIMNIYLWIHWEQSKGEMKDTFHHANSHIYMYTGSYLEQLCKDQIECDNVGIKAFILAYNNISHIMINNGDLAECSQVEMCPRAFPRDSRAKAVMKPNLYSRVPLTFKFHIF
jgi:hypothetical protein